MYNVMAIFSVSYSLVWLYHRSNFHRLDLAFVHDHDPLYHNALLSYWTL